MKEHEISNIDVHAPFLVNLGNSITIKYSFSHSITFMRDEMERTEALGSEQIVMHPGSHVGEGVDKGLNKIIKGLNEVLTRNEKVQISLPDTILSMTLTV